MALGKLEAAFWGKMRDGFKKIGPLGSPILLDRIESPGTGRGIPDIFMTDPEYGDCWIELKIANHNKINLSALQSTWLSQHAKHGVRCRILALLSNGVVRVWDGIDAPLVRSLGTGVVGPEVAPPIDWHAVRMHLFHGLFA